jgi:hypothetical protein
LEISNIAFRTVENINEIILCNLFEDDFTSEKYQKRMEDVSHNYLLGFASNGDHCVIDFLGQQIWNSEDDDREWDDDKDCPAETLDAYIFRQMNTILSLDLRLIEKALNK